MNDINDIISIQKANNNQVRIDYIEMTKPDINQSKIDALSRRKKIEVLKKEETSETQKQIDMEYEFPSGNLEGQLATISPRINILNVNLNKILNDGVNSEIVQKIKSLADRASNLFTAKFVISKKEIDSKVESYGKDYIYKIFSSKISMASNIIATECRYGPANFIITNSSILKYIDLDHMRQMNIKTYIDESIVDQILVGRKSNSTESGLQYIVNESNPENITYAISEIGFFPHKNYITINIIA